MTQNPSETGALGNKSEIDKSKARNVALYIARSAKFTASKILYSHDEKRSKRLFGCKHYSYSEIGLEKSASSAHFSGLRSCDNAWCCPLCASRIAFHRKAELDQLLQFARANGYAVALLTLTIPHARSEPLAENLGLLKKALNSFRSNRRWKSLPLVGSVAATEITHGANGFHPHLHLILLLDGPDALASVENLRSSWETTLRNLGKKPNQHAFQLQDGSAAGDYIAKFGPAEEMTLTHVKKGRSGNRSPWEILADAKTCSRSAAIWLEYALAVKGRRLLVWSNGLKALAQIGEVADHEIPDPPPIQTLRVWQRGGLWTSARQRYCALLLAAQKGSDLDAAEFGPTDVQTLDALAFSFELIETPP